MMPCRRRVSVFVITALLLAIARPLPAEDQVLDLVFEQPPALGSDEARTLSSLKKIQGTGQFCQDGLYLMTHYGDREALFERENQKAIDEPLIDQTWRHCSLFSAAGGDSVVMGRNWDNQTVGSIIVSLYHPSKGYSSVSFTRSIDLGFGHKDLEGHKSSPLGGKLLLAPFYAYDAMNDQGLAAGVAGVRQVTVKPLPEKKLLFVPFLIRKILDKARTVDEAVRLVDQFIPFDLDQNSLNSHVFVVDARGKSVILEYLEEGWHATYPDRPWQVLANRPIHTVADAMLKAQCRRYRHMSETLEQAGGCVDWKSGLKTLQDVGQNGTTWSVVYSLPTRELHFTVYQEWHVVYHVGSF